MYFMWEELGAGGGGGAENHVEEFKKKLNLYGIKMTQISLLNNHKPKIFSKHNTAGWNEFPAKLQQK